MAKILTAMELLQQRREDLFIGREDERDAFRRNFHCERSQRCLIFAFHGQAGIGKSFLVARYQEIARQEGALTALTNEADATAIRDQSIVRAMARLVSQFADAGAPLKTFDERYSQYRYCIHQIEADPDAPPGTFGKLARATARIATRATRATLVGQAAEGALREIGAGEEWLVDWAEAGGRYLAQKFKAKHDLVALVKEPVETLTPLFVHDLNALADDRPIVLCFDTWERTGPHLDAWLRSLYEREGLGAGVWLVIAGRNPPGDEWEPFLPIMACFELHEFTEDETRDYLRKQNITDEARVEQIIAFSGGVPVLVSTLASARGGSAVQAANSLVERYLTWVEDPRHRQAALRCAAARRLDRHVVAAVIGGEDDALFDWLTEMPFVQSHPGYWEYIPTVRRLMLRFARSRSVRDANTVHGRLRAYYRDLLLQKADESCYRDETWRQHTLEALYHGLMQQSADAEREGLETFLLALRAYYPLAGEIVMTWLQAAEEQEALTEVTRWVGLLGPGWSAIETESWSAALPLCAALAARGDLSDPARGEAYHISGLAHHDLGDYERAIDEYTRTIDLEPHDALVFENRGNAYARLHDYERAIADYGRAIELDPQYATAYNNRGLAYAEMHDYERAIADYDRAIELDPEDAAAYNNRGLAYAEMHDYERAIADYARAIELAPEYGAAYSNRGLAYRRLEDYERAIADYTRAIDLDPEYAPAYNNRGLAHAQLANYERAIADYGRAIELDPGDATPYYNMACAYALMSKPKEACEWLQRATDLDEKYRDIAQRDEGFDGIRDDTTFSRLMSSMSSAASRTHQRRSLFNE